MELKGLIIALVTSVLGIFGLFGWSHKSLRQRISDVEAEMYKKASYSDVRTIMSDKIAPLQVEYHSLTKRIDDLKSEHHKLSDKIDKLLVICTRMSHGK